jgi:hypothetical protein
VLQAVVFPFPFGEDKPKSSLHTFGRVRQHGVQRFLHNWLRRTVWSRLPVGDGADSRAKAFREGLVAHAQCPAESVGSGAGP